MDAINTVLAKNMADLSNIERRVISWRFGINGEPRRLTLEETGRRVGLTKERIRQIQRNALGKMREAAKKELLLV